MKQMTKEQLFTSLCFPFKEKFIQHLAGCKILIKTVIRSNATSLVATLCFIRPNERWTSAIGAGITATISNRLCNRPFITE